VVAGGGRWGGEASIFNQDGDALHMARWDPPRVLAEVQAKRAILDLHRPEEFHDTPGGFFCRHDQGTAGIWPCQTVRLLCLPYADHPDYQQEWRP
jgi:hypothetical protein